jgi:hypothetical protein
MVFTETSATLTVKDVCQNVRAFVRRHWPGKLEFYFTVFALTENSSLVEGKESEAIG